MRLIILGFKNYHHIDITATKMYYFVFMRHNVFDMIFMRLIILGLKTIIILKLCIIIAECGIQNVSTIIFLDFFY